jgi:hypothetical protein
MHVLQTPRILPVRVAENSVTDLMEFKIRTTILEDPITKYSAYEMLHDAFNALFPAGKLPCTHPDQNGHVTVLFTQHCPHPSNPFLKRLP